MKLLHHIASLFIALSALAAETVLPPLGSGNPVHGELVSSDFIHRSGQFRTEQGELINFTMPPYAVMKYRGTEADLRDVPLGTKMTFLLLPDENGQLTRLITTQDDQPVDEAQRQKFIDFNKARGLPGWIEKTEGKQMIVTFFSGDPKNFRKTWMDDLSVGKEIMICVSNDELCTWNPVVDAKRGSVREVHSVPADGFGNSGVRLVITANVMLEGFRKGRIVRLFGSGWKMQDQFFGENLMGYGFGPMLNQELIENVAKEYPDQFPFRTDYGNAHLSWYQLKPGVIPPRFSEHLALGELVKLDPATRSGQFLTDGSGELVNFTITEEGAAIQDITSKPGDFGPTGFRDTTATARYLGADVPLAALPTGIRYRFHTYQDKAGRSTRVSYICDEFTRLAANHITGRLIAVSLGKGRLHVAWQIPEVKNHTRDMHQPPDIGHSILRVIPETRVWKAGQPVSLNELQLGDLLLLNLTSEKKNKPAHCTDVWITDNPKKAAAKAPNETRSAGAKQDNPAKRK